MVYVLFHYLCFRISCLLLQVNSVERGFSVLNNGPLDMRMNPQVRVVVIFCMFSSLPHQLMSGDSWLFEVCLL